MFAAGLLNEVRLLLARGYSPQLPSMSGIGYRECCQVLAGQMTVEAAKVEMRRLTRVFVRRQANWFRETDPQIHWFPAAGPDLLDKILNLLQTTLTR
jgi:tRNA dimethylallyltransferase